MVVIPAHAGNVLVWSTDHSRTDTAAVAAWLQASGLFTSVTGVDANSMTLGQLTAYDELLYFSNGGSAGQNPTSIGNVLDSYAGTGRRLVLAVFSWADQGNNTFGGDIISTGDSPFVLNGSSLYTTATMSSNDGSEFFTGVNTLTGFYRDSVALTPGATQRGSWSDGIPLEATKGNVGAVNLFPDDGFGNVSGDYRTLFVDALTAQAGPSSVPEPATLGLIALSLFALAGKYVRR